MEEGLEIFVLVKRVLSSMFAVEECSWASCLVRDWSEGVPK
jgi:hypothetical protein